MFTVIIGVRYDRTLSEMEPGSEIVFMSAPL